MRGSWQPKAAPGEEFEDRFRGNSNACDRELRDDDYGQDPISRADAQFWNQRYGFVAAG